MTTFNSAMSYTLGNALSVVYPDYFIDYASALVSRGILPEALNPTVTSTVAGQVDFAWEDNSLDYNANASDLVLLVVFNPAKNQAVTVTSGNPRSAVGQIMTVPATFSGDEVHCYVAFQNANQSVLSNSVYVGAVVVA